MITLDSVIKSTTLEEQQKEVTEKLAYLSPNALTAIHELLAEGRGLDEIILPGTMKGKILYTAPDAYDPIDFSEHK